MEVKLISFLDKLWIDDLMHVPTIQTSSSAPSAHAGTQLKADPARILNISCC